MAVSILLIAVLVVSLVMMLTLPEIYTWRILLFFLLFVPTSAQGLISGTSYSTGGVINLSMIGYLTLCALIIFILFRNKQGLKKYPTIVVMSCFLIILVIRVIGDGADFISNKLLDNYFLPMLLAVMIVSYMKVEYIPQLLKFIYICILIGAVIAIIEYFYGQSLFFHSYYNATVTWYNTTNPYVHYRSTSLYGHALTGGLYYSLGVVYWINSDSFSRNKVLSIFQIGILVGAVLTTNSRSPLLGLAIYVVYYLLKNKKIGKILAVVILIAAVSLCVDWSSLYETFFARDSGGSSYMVRVTALQSIFKIPFETVVLGEGYNNTSSLLTSLGFSTNVEISYLIILLENGLFGFLAWLGSIVFLYQGKMDDRRIHGQKIGSTIKGMLMCIFIIGAMSNSFGDPGSLNYTIYILLGFSYVFSRADENQLVYIENLPERHRVRFKFGMR